MANENTQPDSNADGQAEPNACCPLEREWTLWFDEHRNLNVKNWSTTKTSVSTVSTVNDFWCLFNNIVSPGAITAQKADLFFFMNGVKPDWAESETQAGGIWSVELKKLSNVGADAGMDPKELLGKWWMDLILHLIGEQFEEGSDIVGLACCIRGATKAGDRLQVWTKTAANEAMQMSIGKQIKELLGIPPQVTIGFVSHENAKMNNKSNQQDTYTA